MRRNFTGYFISPPQETSWTFDVEALTRSLRAAWPRVEVERISNLKSIHCLRWTIDDDVAGPIEGTLATNGNTVHVDGDLQRAAAIAVWVRTLVPADQELIFYDEGYSADVPVTRESTEEELARPFMAGG